MKLLDVFLVNIFVQFALPRQRSSVVYDCASNDCYGFSLPAARIAMDFTWAIFSNASVSTRMDSRIVPNCPIFSFIMVSNFLKTTNAPPPRAECDRYDFASKKHIFPQTETGLGARCELF